MTKTEFASVLAYLETAVGVTIPPNRAEVYFDLLGDLPLSALQLAARQALLESRYPTFPTVGTLRQLAVALLQPPALQAAEAWELVLRAVNRYGLSGMTRALATLPEPARSAARAIGWASLCDMTLEQTPTVRAQFRVAYNEMATRAEHEALPPAKYQQRAAGLLAGVAEVFQLERGA